MDTSMLPLAAFILTAIGWISREIRHWLKDKREAAQDAIESLNKKKALLQEMLNGIEDASQKEELRIQIDEINTALLGLHSARLRRFLKTAGLPPEEALIADGLIQLQPQQVDQLKGEIAELKELPQSDSIWDLMAQGSAYYYAEQYEDAKDIYDRILNLTPNDPAVLTNRGVLYEKLERHDDALTDYNRALELSPDNPDTLNNRGNTLGKLERYDDALADFNRSLELKPDHPGTLNNRGITYKKLERYDDALADYNRSLKLRPDDPDTLYNQGTTYTKMERYDEALADYNRALELRPDHSDTLNNRGVTYGKLERYDEALADFNHALELSPDDPSTLYNLACLFSMWGKTEDALAYLEKAIDGDKKNQEDAKTDTDLDNIRDDPRFKKLMESD